MKRDAATRQEARSPAGASEAPRRLPSDQELACAVSEFLMARPPGEWPLSVVRALDRYAQETGFRGWERGPARRAQ